MPTLRVTIDMWMDEDHLALITGWARAGLTYQQIAENMGISRTTLVRWRMQNKELDNALKVNKEIADCHVENALYKSALGFNYEEQVVSNKSEVLWVTKFERPNITAQIFYLKNRRPGIWTDRREIKHEADIKAQKIVVKWGGEVSGDEHGD